jgi:hypothetical protein
MLVCVHHSNQGSTDHILDCGAIPIALSHALKRGAAVLAIFARGDTKGGQIKMLGTLKCFKHGEDRLIGHAKPH